MSKEQERESLAAEARHLADEYADAQAEFKMDQFVAGGQAIGDSMREARVKVYAAIDRLAALASPAAEPVQAGWIPVSERLPESGVKVLACYVNRAGKPRRICAEWIAAKSRESGSESDIGEYDEADDTFYDPQGWYECIDNWDDYTSVAVVEGEISHWMPLPPAPEGAA